MSSPPTSPGGAPADPFLERVRAAVAPKYQVVRLLGRGGMAAVFLATEARLGRNVALKVMAPDLMADAGMVERFAHEARTTAQLTSPHVVTVFDVDERDGLHFFTMHYVGGRTLGQVMDWASAPLPIAVVRGWMAQVAAALSHAHRRGVIHRDVKPSNVLVDVEGSALVSDFGIAKLVLGDPNLTRTGQIVGTPTYMSPEQCIGGLTTPASDQYAFGAVAYQMVTGNPPFTGPTLSVLNAQVSEPPLPILERRPDCPPDLAAGIQRMLAKRPEERWSDLDEAARHMGLSVPPQGDAAWSRMEALAVPAAGVRVEEVPTGLRPGGRGQARAIPVDAAGRPIPERRVHWESSNPSLLAVDPGGGVEALGPGMMTLTARCDGVEARVAVPVAPEDTIVLSAPPVAPPGPQPPAPPALFQAPPNVPTPPPVSTPVPTPVPAPFPTPPPTPFPQSASTPESWPPASPPSPPPTPASPPREPEPSGAVPAAGGAGRPSRTPLLVAVVGVLLVTLVGAGLWTRGRGDGTETGGPLPPEVEVADAAATAPVEDPAGGEVEPPTGGEGGAEGEGSPAAAPSPPAADTPEPTVRPPAAAVPPPATAGTAAVRPPAERGDDPPAATTPPPQPAPRDTPAPAVDPAPAAPDAAGPPASAEVQQITSIARRLMEAVANRDEEAIRVEYQAFTGNEPWWLFAADSAGEYGRTVRLQPQTQVIPIGNTATVVFSLSIDLEDDAGTVVNQRTYPLAMRFERGDAGWWLADLR